MLHRNYLPLILSILFASIYGCSSQTDEPRDIGEWRDIGTTSEMRFYVSRRIEVGSKIDNPFVGIKMLWNFNHPQKREEGIYQSTVFKILVDCDRLFGSDFSYTNYSEKMSMGVVIASGERNFKEAENELEKIENPATKAVAEYVCKIKKSNRLLRP